MRGAEAGDVGWMVGEWVGIWGEGCCGAKSGLLCGVRGLGGRGSWRGGSEDIVQDG